MTVMSPPVAPAQPFPGISSYSYRDRSIYFGRDAEARQLFQLISLYRGVMLFGDSGIGKSSLLNAAVLPAAVADELRPVLIRVRPVRGQTLTLQSIDDLEAVPTRAASDDIERRAVSCEEFDGLLRQLQIDEPDAHPLLIFDQLEELVTLFASTSRDGEIDDTGPVLQAEIVSLITGLLTDHDRKIKVVLSFREDYLAKFRSWFARVPFLDDHYLRIEPLAPDRESIAGLIRAPFERFPGDYGDRIDHGLALSIADSLIQRYAGNPIRLSELQIVCRSLFESATPARDIATLGCKGIIERYYASALESLGAEVQTVAIQVLDRLITESGTRNIVSRDDLIADITGTGRVPREVVESALTGLDEQAHLVSRERRKDVEFFEIVSEYLIPWIQEQVAVRVDPDEVTALRSELLHGAASEVLGHRAAKRRRTAIALGPPLAALVGFLVYLIAAFFGRDFPEAVWLSVIAAAVAAGAVAWGLVCLPFYLSARRRSSRAELLYDHAERFLLDATPRTRDDLTNVRSDYYWRFVPLRVDDPTIAQRHAGGLGETSGAVGPDDVEIRRELLAGPTSEAARYQRRARVYRTIGWASIVFVVATVGFAIPAGEDFEKEPWWTLYVITFYLALAAFIAWVVPGRRARRRAKNARVVLAQAEELVTNALPCSPDELRTLRIEVQSRFEPLPVDATVVVQSAPSTVAPPNWYPDPSGQPHMRYWDGRSWTGFTATAPSSEAKPPAPAPPPPPKPRPPAPPPAKPPPSPSSG